jgi:transposase
MTESLFPVPEIQEPAENTPKRGKPRLNRPNRSQIEWRLVNLDSLLPEDHEARLVWAWVEEMDLSPLYEHIRAVEGEAGRNAIDPAILVALWLYATLNGVGSARQLERLCQEHLAYMWLCGGVSVNYHSLADFRVGNQEFLDQLLIQSIAALRKEGLVSMQQVAQDGKKIRASAGSSSFHRKETLAKHLEQARQQMETLRKQLEENPNQLSKRQKKARERAVRERLERLEAAKKQLEAMEKRAQQTGRAKKDQKAGKKRRASESDPEARVMKMANGGFNPAYNAQFCTDTESDIIVGVQVSQQGNDTGLACPMLDQVEEVHGERPAEIWADASYFSIDEVVKMSQTGCTPYFAIPWKNSTGKEKVEDTRYLPKVNDAPAVAACRERMATPEAQEKLIKRGAVAELVHAVLEQWTLSRMRVRGVNKVRTVLLWFVLVHNWMRTRLLHKKQAQQVAV